MDKTYRPYDPDQLLLLPPNLREWLPPEHLAYFIADVVDGPGVGRPSRSMAKRS